MNEHKCFVVRRKSDGFLLSWILGGWRFMPDSVCSVWSPLVFNGHEASSVLQKFDLVGIADVVEVC